MKTSTGEADLQNAPSVDLSYRKIDFEKILTILKLNKALKYLILSNCNINIVSEDIGKLVNLEYLDLSHNNINELPYSMSKLKRLVRINLRANEFQEVPRFLQDINVDTHKLKRIDFRENSFKIGNKKLLQWITIQSDENPKLILHFDEKIWLEADKGLENDPFWIMAHITDLINRNTEIDTRHAMVHINRRKNFDNELLNLCNNMSDLEHEIMMEYWYAKGNILEVNGMYNEVIEFYDKMSHNPYILIKKAKVHLFNLDQVEEALYSFDKAISLDTSMDYFVYEKAHALFHLDCLEEALQLCESVENENMTHDNKVEFLDLKHIILVKFERYEEAIDSLNQIVDFVETFGKTDPILMLKTDSVLNKYCEEAKINRIMVLSYQNRFYEALEQTKIKC